jgi:hypothetical protein
VRCHSRREIECLDNLQGWKTDGNEPSTIWERVSLNSSEIHTDSIDSLQKSFQYDFLRDGQSRPFSVLYQDNAKKWGTRPAVTIFEWNSYWRKLGRISRYMIPPVKSTNRGPNQILQGLLAIRIL